MQRIGIFGGTFDPPHIGHLILAEYAAEALDLEQVLFVPAAIPPHKVNVTRSPIEDRLRMLEVAIAANDRFALSRADVDRPGPHYSVDLVKIIQAQNPSAAVFFVMGGDSLRDLPTWNHPDELIRLCKLAVIQRPDMEPISPTMHDHILPGLSERVVIIPAPLLGFSSSEIVARLQSGLSIRYMVPSGVLTYIQDHQLYWKSK
jgi:nicotinate-nucleotide adenylyltransferase